MKIAKWGNSLAIRIPKELAEKHGLKAGDDIEIVVGDKIELRQLPTTAERIAKLRRFQGLIPDDFKFDRDEANER